jgi:hypothetical protein
MKTIGFRVDDEQCRELTRRAELAGVSVHELARRITLQALSEESDLHLVRMEIAKAAAGARKDLRHVAQLILFILGKVPIEDSKKFLTELLDRKAA